MASDRLADPYGRGPDTCPLYVLAGLLAHELVLETGEATTKSVVALAASRGRPVSVWAARAGLWRAWNAMYPAWGIREYPSLRLTAGRGDDKEASGGEG